MQTEPALTPDALLGAFLPYLVFSLIGYVYFAAMLMVIARKTGTPNGWMAWIPIANLVLMCRIAGKSGWLVLVLLIPLVNLIVFAVIWAGIARARGKPGWMGILILVPLVNLLIPAYLAMGEAAPAVAASDAVPSSGPTTQRDRPRAAASRDPRPAAAPRACPQCGARSSEDDAFCGECGTKLPASVAAAPTSAGESSAASREKKGSGGLVAVVIAAVVLLGGGWFLYSKIAYHTPERQAPALPQRTAGILTEFPVDTDPSAPASPGSVITQSFTPQDDGQHVNVPGEWLPPGMEPGSLPRNARSITSTQYHTPGATRPVNVHVVEPTPGYPSQRMIARQVTQSTGGQQQGVRVESPSGRVYQGSRIQTPQVVVFVLGSQRSDAVIVIYAPDPTVAPVAERLAANVGNGQGLLDYPAVRNALWTLPTRPPQGLTLVEANTFTRADFERSLGEVESGVGSDVPEIRELTAQARRFFPERVTLARYADAAQQEWNVGVGEFASSFRAWTTWLAFQGLLRVSSVGATSTPNGEGLYADTDEGRMLTFRKGPYIVVLVGPLGAPVDQLLALSDLLQL